MSEGITMTPVIDVAQARRDAEPIEKNDVVFDIQKLTASYGKQPAVSDVDLEIYRNIITAVIGPSGCGKSTFIRCLNRMNDLVPGARIDGKILYQGDDLYASGVDPVEVRRRIGMVFQRANPFPTMSVLENAVAGLKLGSKLSKSVLRERGEQALQRAGLWNEVKDRLDQPGGRLSGGQQQRLCIARALAVEPDVLLMDEPASALDPASTLRIEELVEELKESVTFVIVTHNMQQAGRIADWTMFLLNGEVVEAGPTERIFTTPTDRRTEDYVTGRFG
jgi:phosphate transport system ATP-binding protein